MAALPIGILRVLTTLGVGEDPDRLGAFLFGISVVVVPFALLLPISWAASTVATLAIIHREAPTVRSAYRPVVRSLWPLIVALLVYTAAIAMGLSLLILPGVFITIAWLFVSQAVVIEGRSITDSFRRSLSLTLSVQAFVACLVTYVVYFAITIGATRLVALLLGVWIDHFTTANVVIWCAVMTVVIALIVPLQAIGISLLYLDRFVRREGHWPTLPRTA